MRKETSEWSIRMLADFEKRINVDAEYQRADVWSQPQQALLIDSIMRGFDIPKIFLRKLPDGSPYLFDVIDGKQRLTAIWKFISDDFCLLSDLDQFPDLGNLGGMRWSDLPDDAKDRFQFTNITVSKIEDATKDEIHELFLRLQKGEPLNAAERRNAMSGPVRDFVANNLVTHPVWNSIGLRSKRFGIHENSAIVLALVLKGGPTGLKGADLHRLYERKTFDPNGESAKRTIEFLDIIKQISDIKQKNIRTRWGLVDLLVVLMRLKAENKNINPQLIMDFFDKFEEERRSVSTVIADLQTKIVEFSIDDNLRTDEIETSTISPDMLSYYLAFAREGANEANVSTRSNIMYQKLCSFMNNKKHAN